MVGTFFVLVALAAPPAPPPALPPGDRVAATVLEADQRPALSPYVSSARVTTACEFGGGDDGARFPRIRAARERGWPALRWIRNHRPRLFCRGCG